MNEDLTTFIEPELEVRLVALVLGETSAFEREELERIIAERPEARLFKNRMEALHCLVDEASNPVADVAWKLSGERRDKVLAKIRETQVPVAVPPRRKAVSQFRRRLVFYGSAACFVAVVAGLSTPAIRKNEKSARPAPVIVSYSVEADEMDLKETLAAPKVEARGRGSAGDLLASIDGDYSLDVPTSDFVEDSKSKNFSSFSQSDRAQGVKEDRQTATRADSVNGKVNTRDGGMTQNQTAALSSGQRVVVPSSGIAGKSGASNGLTTNVEYRDVTLDGFVHDGNKTDEEPIVKMGEPASEPEPVTATAALGNSEKAKVADSTRFAGVAGNLESLAVLPEPAAREARGWSLDFGSEGEKDALERSLRTSVEAKPAAPSSSMGKVIAANTASPVEVPALEVEFGEGKDFGDGWGAGQSGAGSSHFLGGGADGSEANFNDLMDGIQIPGIPEAPKQAVAGIVTGGLRSGSAAVDREQVDAFLNGPQKPSDRPADLPGDADPFAGGGGEADPFAPGGNASLAKRESVSLERANPESEDGPRKSIRVQSKFVEVEQENIEELGFDWAEPTGDQSAPGGPLADGMLSERMVRAEDPQLDGITLTDEESEKLHELGDIVQEKRKVLTKQIQKNGIPYFDGRGSSPAGETEEMRYRNAQSKLNDFESDRDVLVKELQKVRGGKTQNSDQIEDALESKLSLMDRQVDKLREIVDSKQDVTVELSLKQKRYDQTKEDYEVALDEFRGLKESIAARGTWARESRAKGEVLPVEVDAEMPEAESADILERRFVVPEGFETFLSAGISHGDDDPFGGSDDSEAAGIQPRLSIVELLKNSGVSFPLNSAASFLEGSNTLIVRSTPSNLELIDGIVKSAGVETGKAQELERQKQIALENFETSTSEKSDSTFSLNVSDVSFKLAKSSLANGQWPEADKVRPEEFVNALSYGDNTPTQAEKVACVIEQGSHPFMQQRNLMRVSMSTAALGRNASTPLRLTVLLDQSGSMERADRAESVRRAFALLTSQLNAHDEITLVGFARTPRLLAERVKGNESGKLAEIVGNPLTEGGTNLEAALSSGLQLAKQQFVEGAQNRIILLTDGAANLGDALPKNLARQVARMRDAGIAFDACGVGADGLNDEVLTSLAKQGDGRYYFLDRPEDADEGFARQIAGALRPAAKNVKVQVIFNPERVSNFKLYGFEKHQLKKEDFRNDAVDAAEMAAEESGVALYHFQPLPEGRGDIGTVSVRFLDTATDQMVERTWTIPYQPDATSFSDANPALRLASVAGLFAERLKGSPVGERVELKRLRQETELLKPVFRNQARFQEFQTMLQQAGE